MTIEIAQFLLSPDGRDLLAQADGLRTGRAETLPALTRLRRTASPEQAAAAWEMSDLRRRGAAKFGPEATQMYFTREALEQASSARAAVYHASRFAEAGVTTVADLCGGIGGDALAFARQGLHVTLYECDPIRTLFARENAAVYGLAELVRIVDADVTEVPLGTAAAWFDPARRQESRRVSDPDDYLPPLSFLQSLEAQGVTDIGVKLSPAIDHSLAVRYAAELEFISDGGECKEALLWRGRLRNGHPLRATKLTDSGPLSLFGPPDIESRGEDVSGRFLYEPDPAAIRSHLVRILAEQLHAVPAHPQIAYLIGDTFVPTPWAAAYEILERFTYSRRRLQEALTKRGAGRVVIKKRGFPQEPDAVRKGLKLVGPNEITVVLTRQGAGHQVLLCRPLKEGNSYDDIGTG